MNRRAIINIAFDPTEKNELEPIPIQDKYTINTEDPNIINQWLIGQGANDVYNIFFLNENNLHSLREMIVSKLTEVIGQVNDQLSISFLFPTGSNQYKKIINYLESLKTNIFSKIQQDPNKYLSQDQFINGTIVDFCQKISNLVNEKILTPQDALSDTVINEFKKSCRALSNDFANDFVAPVKMLKPADHSNLKTELFTKLKKYPTSGFTTFKTFNKDFIKKIKSEWEEIFNADEEAEVPVSQSLNLIYRQLNRAKRIKAFPSVVYYGQFATFSSGKMIPILEGVKEYLEEHYSKEAKYYKIIYMQFQKYLQPWFRSASGTFSYDDIFGRPDGFANKIIDNCQNEEALKAEISRCIEKALKTRKERWDKEPGKKDTWVKRDDSDKWFQKNADKSDMVKTLRNIQKLLLKELKKPEAQKASKKVIGGG